MGPYNIFVYGTLMRGERAHGYLKNAAFVGEYRLKDYALYNLGRYPGIRPMSGGTVYGEVYEITADMLSEMDRYEGEGSLYHRVPVTVQSDGGMIDAQAYVYAQKIRSGRIESGSWKNRQQ